jgi:hypothetical protein
MKRRIGNMIILELTEDSICELCGKKDELRPYGPNGENICYDCGMKDEAKTQQMMSKTLFGEEISYEEAKSAVERINSLESSNNN